MSKNLTNVLCDKPKVRIVGNVRTILYIKHIWIFSSDCVQYRKQKQQYTTTCKLKYSVIGTRHLKEGIFFKNERRTADVLLGRATKVKLKI